MTESQSFEGSSAENLQQRWGWVAGCVHAYVLERFQIRFSTPLNSGFRFHKVQNTDFSDHLHFILIHSVGQFSCSAMSRSLQPHGLQHARPPCPSPTPRAYSLMSIESAMPPKHLILCHPLLLPPSIFPSIRVFINESVLRIRWPKYWCSAYF